MARFFAPSASTALAPLAALAPPAAPAPVAALHAQRGPHARRRPGGAPMSAAEQVRVEDVWIAELARRARRAAGRTASPVRETPPADATAAR